MSKKLKKRWKCYHTWKMWGLIQIKTSVEKYNKKVSKKSLTKIKQASTIRVWTS